MHPGVSVQRAEVQRRGGRRAGGLSKVRHGDQGKLQALGGVDGHHAHSFPTFDGQGGLGLPIGPDEQAAKATHDGAEGPGLATDQRDELLDVGHGLLAAGRGGESRPVACLLDGQTKQGSGGHSTGQRAQQGQGGHRERKRRIPWVRPGGVRRVPQGSP